MDSSQPDRKPDIKEDFDQGESLSLTEPLLLSSGYSRRQELIDLALDLVDRSASLRSSLPSGISDSLAALVRTVNCYYSNLIEGHATHPIDIERALKQDFSKDEKKRNLQLEAKAHVEVQEWIDAGALAGRSLTVGGLTEVHKRFCENLPDDLLYTDDRSTAERIRIEPGALRTRFVSAGRHIPVSPGAVPRFLLRFEQAYANLGRSESILAAAAAHHRLLWVHPFLDGNGRVARLMSHAQLLESLNTGALWSIARGLARNVDDYKQHLENCDTTRRNDLDGRGNLSEQALGQFTEFFLTTCIDQVRFMESLIEPTHLRNRIVSWAEEESRNERLLPRATTVLEAVLYRGELSRGEAPALLGVGERQTRRVVSSLIQSGALVAASDRAPLKLAFPATLAERWMPGLFPELPAAPK